MIMEEDEEGSPGTPFWVQSSGGRRLQISSIFFNSGILIIFLCFSAIFSILFIIPWFLSLTSQIFRPNLVKKSWDWLNAVLIILALIFGFLSRNKINSDDDEDRPVLNVDKSQSQRSFQWDQSSNRSIRTQKLDDNWYDYSSSFGLKRNSSSYPDLRDTSSFLDHRRFLDDTHVENSRLVDPDLSFESDGSKKIYIDTEIMLKKEISQIPVTPPPLRPSFPPSSRESHNVEEKTDRVLKQVMGHSENIKKRSLIQGTPPSTAAELPEKKKSSKSERKRSGGTATKDFLNSFYHQSKKKKKQRAKSLDNFESLLEKTLPPSPPPPSPPPLPPPRTSVFHNILSNKKRKPKKIISVPAPPPPPPPPPPKTERKPIKLSTFKRVGKTHEDSSPPATMGNESPLIPIPPPPPPFKLPSWKFVVQGDYVRVGSFNSSISESSDADERESPVSDISSGTHNTAAPPPSLFCPSPDVNTKADMFIARFRAGLQLQKINSLEQKQRLGMSNLGPQAQDQAQSQAQLRNARK